MAEQNPNLEPVDGDPFGQQAQESVAEVPELSNQDTPEQDRIVDVAAMMLEDVHNKLSDQPDSRFCIMGMSMTMPDGRERMIFAGGVEEQDEMALHLRWVSDPLRIATWKQQQQWNDESMVRFILI